MRHYPKAFGAKIASLLERKPLADLRNKKPIDPSLTDREIFASMHVLETSDCWWDADVPGLYWYLRELPGLAIPDSWCGTIKEFETELLLAAGFKAFDSSVGFRNPIHSSQAQPPRSMEEMVGLSVEECDMLEAA